MSDDEEKPMLITDDLLEQVLRNQKMLMMWADPPRSARVCRKEIAQTIALLARL